MIAIWILKIGLWLVFFTSFLRARSRGRFVEQSTRRIWLLFFLWGDDNNNVFDRADEYIDPIIAVDLHMQPRINDNR